MNTQLKQRLVFALLMGVMTTGIISFTLVSINVGFIWSFLRNMDTVMGDSLCCRNSRDTFHWTQGPGHCKQNYQVMNFYWMKQS